MCQQITQDDAYDNLKEKKEKKNHLWHFEPLATPTFDRLLQGTSRCLKIIIIIIKSSNNCNMNINKTTISLGNINDLKQKKLLKPILNSKLPIITHKYNTDSKFLQTRIEGPQSHKVKPNAEVLQNNKMFLQIRQQNKHRLERENPSKSQNNKETKTKK